MIDALTGRDDQRRYLSSLRAAYEQHKRPTAMIFHDPYWGHRKWWSMWLYGEEWVPSFGDDEWTWEDYLLCDVYKIIDDFTDSESGQFIWWDQSGEVYWDPKRVTSGYLEAVEKAREGDEKPKPGERWTAVPVFRDPDNKPTIRDWMADVADDKNDRRPADARDSRPPSASELAKLRADRMESSES